VINARRDAVLVVGAAVERCAEVAAAVRGADGLPVLAPTTGEAERLLGEAPPDLVVLVLSEPFHPELALLDRLRADAEGEKVAVIVALAAPDQALTLEAFGRRADDVIAGAISPDELIARIAVRLDRRPLPRARLVEDPVTGAMTTEAMSAQIDLELERVDRGGRPATLAYLALDELPGLEARFGSRVRDQLLAEVVRLIKADGRQVDYVGISRGLVLLLLPATPEQGAQLRLERLSRLIHGTELSVGTARASVTPLIGHTEATPGLSRETLEDRAWAALMHEADQLDLHPTPWEPAMSEQRSAGGPVARAVERFRTPLQVAFQQLVCFGLPFGAYQALDAAGLDITGGMYLVLVAALALTATLIGIECLGARRRPEPPAAPAGAAPPPASAVIAAYLPNEADTIVETVEAFLAQDYPDLQVILAYNTPRSLDVERELHAIAARDPRFEPLRVEGSVSKAQNVNAALTRVRGEFVGLFDADHHPEPGSFRRAWRWLARDADVVQGHCVVRNGDRNLLTRLVAVEFEVIYAVSHPGRARMHGFGIFGGSNGYWRTDLLERTRMRGFMLTEDIDSSLRVVQDGARIVSDPGLISTELAPETPKALWNQRMRWSQGWSQVSLRHLARAVRRPLGARRRLGVAHLLGWRELYPWISLQTAPLLACWLLRGEPAVRWFVPVFVATTLFTLSAGPMQAWFAWRLAHPSVKRHPRWFLLYVLASTLFYSELKNVVARTAHIKEAMRERQWKVTPRAARPTTGTLGRTDVLEPEALDAPLGAAA